MPKKYFLFFAFFSLIAVFSPLIFAEENNEVDRFVFVGLYLLNLGKFDISTGSFSADFYLSLKCERVCPKQEFEFMNGRASNFEKIIDEPNEKFYRIQANLVSPADLKKFPFDSQKMEIIIEDKRKSSKELIYIPDYNMSGFDRSISFVGWEIREWRAYSREHYYEVYNETYSQYVFEIPIRRIKINSFFKTFLPVIFIMLVMLSSYVLDLDKIVTRIGMVSSALIASVMFHISIANQLPSTSYLTFIDKFMILSYFIILLSFVFNVSLLELIERKKDEHARKLHRIAEFSMFLLALLLYFLLFLFFG